MVMYASDSDIYGEVLQEPMQILKRQPILDTIVTALEQRPETLNVAGLDRATHELALSVVHRFLDILRRLSKGIGSVLGDHEIGSSVSSNNPPKVAASCVETGLGATLQPRPFALATAVLPTVPRLTLNFLGSSLFHSLPVM